MKVTGNLININAKKEKIYLITIKTFYDVQLLKGFAMGTYTKVVMINRNYNVGMLCLCTTRVIILYPNKFLI